MASSNGKPAAHPGWFGAAMWVAAAVLAAGVGIWLAKRQAEGGSKQVAPPAAGLPNTPDYHSLLVAPDDPRRIVLGTHAGLYESRDGGRTWRKGELAGNDAMNLVRTKRGRVWAAGHNVLFASDDGGTTWEEVRPSGLPNLDLHGFAADPRDSNVVYAAAAGAGLYRSEDAGRSFSLLSEEVGGSVFGLAVTSSGRLLAADAGEGLLASGDGGKSWSKLGVSAVGVAVNPDKPQTVVATGNGIFLSRDGGGSWRRVLEVGAGPVAWAPSKPAIAYAVGFDRMLYRTRNGGRTWRPVA